MSVPRGRGVNPERSRRAVLLAAALLLLNVSVTFENVWPTPRVRWWGGVSIELAVCLVLMAVLAWRRGRPLSRLAIAWLSVAWTALVLGRYADVTAPALYGREINLYWDTRYMPDVAAMITRVTPLWMLFASVVAVSVILWLMWSVIRWAWSVVGTAMVLPAERRVVATAAIAVVAFFAVNRIGGSSMPWVFQVEE